AGSRTLRFTARSPQPSRRSCRLPGQRGGTPSAGGDSRASGGQVSTKPLEPTEGTSVPAAIVMGPPLIVALVAALVAGRRGWAPPLWLSVSVGAALRLLIMTFAALDATDPYDFQHDFTGAADHVLDGRNPTLHMREGGWHFLP